uniref:Uncharacterized protein n=1 Tax=Anopheles darlingi TaxID=43151 RepID=A0A2M4D1L2_ANODA
MLRLFVCLFCSLCLRVFFLFFLFHLIIYFSVTFSVCTEYTHILPCAPFVSCCCSALRCQTAHTLTLSLSSSLSVCALCLNAVPNTPPNICHQKPFAQLSFLFLLNVRTANIKLNASTAYQLGPGACCAANPLCNHAVTVTAAATACFAAALIIMLSGTAPAQLQPR